MKIKQTFYLIAAFLAANFSGYSQSTFPTNGLVASYTFNTNLLDSSGNQHNGVLNGSGISYGIDRFNISNAALSFAGGGYVSITPTPFNVNADYSVCFWGKIANPNNSVNNVFSTGADRALGLNFRYVFSSASDWEFLPSGYTEIGSTRPTNYNAWHSIVCVHANTNDFLYIDGQLVTSTNHTTTTADAGSFWLGRHEYNGFNYDMQGALDDLHIYNRALSNSEIAMLYTNELNGAVRPALASASMTNGFVIGTTIIDTGFGYTNVPGVRFIGGGGGNAQATAVVSNSMVISLTIVNPGSGYTNTPLVVIDPPFLPNPFLNTALLSYLYYSNLVSGSQYQLQQFGSNFWTNTTVTFVAASGPYTQVVTGFVRSGSYRLALAPAPIQAFATPQTVNGFVVGATITQGGSGYSVSPVVNIYGGSGSNASGVAQVNGGVVTNILITNAGIGYTNAPTIYIAPPPAGSGIAPVIQPWIRLDISKLSAYDNYQIQTSADLRNWSNYPGGFFTATNATNSQIFFVTNNLNFFRLHFVP